jgi:hypothetical protein
VPPSLASICEGERFLPRSRADRRRPL